MKFRDVRGRLRTEGWQIVRQTVVTNSGSTQLIKGRVTVSGHDGATVPTGTLRNIVKQAGW